MEFYTETNCTSDEPLFDHLNFPSVGDFKYFDDESFEIPRIETGETMNSPKNKDKIFDIVKEKKVGRKRMRDHKIGEKIHTKYDQDNVIRKIQVDFYKFLICFINDILMNLGIKNKFLKINYKNIKNVKKENVEIFKSTEIGQILSQNISSKYKKQYLNDKDKNNKLYLEVIKKDNIKTILSETSINIFRNYYYKTKRDLNEYGINIKLSKNIKTYQNLLDKYSTDGLYIKKIKEIVDKFYLPKEKFILNKKIINVH